jgi:hypothetical protein
MKGSVMQSRISSLQTSIVGSESVQVIIQSDADGSQWIKVQVGHEAVPRIKILVLDSHDDITVVKTTEGGE